MFTVGESNLICIYAGESRSEVMEDIESALPNLDDTNMKELSCKMIGKLLDMTNEEFAELKFIVTE